MKRTRILTVVAALWLGQIFAWGQLGPSPGGAMAFGAARFDAMMAKLFGSNTAFSASLEIQTKDPRSSETVVIPGQLSFLDGKSRFAVDISQAKGAKMPPGAGAQLKAMGMAEMVMVSRPDKKTSLLVYPGLEGYVEQPVPSREAVPAADQVKMETTDLGQETIEGHPCVKSKATITVAEGSRFEVTVWNAADLKHFPLRVEVADAKTPTSMSFKDVTFTKPAAGSFDPPTGFTRYDSPQSLFQQGMMKMLGGGK